MASDAPLNERPPTFVTGSVAGPYVLRPLLQNVPLSADGGNEDIKINCVDFLGIYPPNQSAPSVSVSL